jgi:hypothetical protein
MHEHPDIMLVMDTLTYTYYSCCAGWAMLMTPAGPQVLKMLLKQ